MPEKTLRDKIADEIHDEGVYDLSGSYYIAGKIITVLPEQPKGMSEDEIKIILRELNSGADDMFHLSIYEIDRIAFTFSGKNFLDLLISQSMPKSKPEEKTCENCGYNHCTTKNKYVACSEWKKKEVVELPEDLPVFFPDDTVSMIETQAAMVLMRDYINKILRYLRQREERG